MQEDRKEQDTKREEKPQQFKRIRSDVPEASCLTRQNDGINPNKWRVMLKKNEDKKGGATVNFYVDETFLKHVQN